ncbi:glycosyltransferase family 2 protein [Candidatus Woesebacteria bacterium]|nr:glycosyltransferase family 2 protein [Candidatus Woesebacteria bacterium]
MSNPSTVPVSIIVHTKNSATTLERCLASLPQAAELLVVDMASTDETLLIARRFHARTLSVADVGYVEPARAVAIDSVTQPWVLIVDADEEMPKAAGEWLSDLLRKNEHQVFALPRRNTIFGRPMKYTGWWPDYQVRLFQKGAVVWPETIHAQPICEQEPVKLPATDDYALIHHNYQHIDQFIDRMNRYTSIEAQGKRLSKEDEWLSLQSGELFSRLSARKGWKDGEQGLAASLLQSYYPLVSALKRWEAEGFPTADDFESSLDHQLATLHKEISYWRATYRIEHLSGLLKIYWQIRRKMQL